MDQSNPPVFIGEWIKKRRKALDLTQEELARRASCSVFTLRKIESGIRRPSKQLAELLAEALELHPEEKQTFIRAARRESGLERLQSPLVDSSLASIAGPQPDPVSNHIPLQPTPLVGRDSELAAMEKLFNNPQCRLLTLTGMGGIGKTRLAVEFAARQQSAFPAGVYYVPLAPIASAEAIVPAVADVLGFVFSGPNDPREQLINYMSVQFQQSTLLVLDNLEHLLVPSLSDEQQGAAKLISELLQRLPHLKILATSRERLNLQGEWTYELHGLAVPPAEFAGKLEDYSAAAFFLQSATRAKADFELTAAEQPALILICQVLDGIPLAIELAAAWVGMLSCQEISQEIRSNIDFLTTSMRDIPERHRSLRATFDHSWSLLSLEERNALCRLSVFHGGFDRKAAEQIAGATLPLLASLVSKSLVRRTKNGRYDLHEAIRQYAASHLDANPSQCGLTCDLHGEHYLRFVSGFEKKMKSAAQQEAIREISDSLDNIRAAWNWAMNQHQYGLLGGATRSMGWFFEETGLLREGIEHLEPLVEDLKAESRDDDLNRILGLALIHQALLYFRTGQFVHAQEIYQESIAVLSPIGDQHLLADAHIFSGIIAHLNGAYTQSRFHIHAGLEYARAANNRWFEAYGIYNLGYVDSLEGLYQEGYEQMLTGLEMWREIGDPHGIALGLNFLVPTLNKLERYEEAKAFMRESIRLSKQTKHRWGMGTAHRYLGLTMLAEGNHSEAQNYFRKSLEIFGEYVEGWDIALSLAYLGEATMLAGDLQKARKYYLKALRISVDANAIPIAMDSLCGVANLYARTSEPENALELYHYILNHPSTTQVTKDRASEMILEIEKLLTSPRAHAIKAGVLNTSFEDILSKFNAASIR